MVNFHPMRQTVAWLEKRVDRVRPKKPAVTIPSAAPGAQVLPTSAAQLRFQNENHFSNSALSKFETLPVEMIHRCLRHLDTVDERGRDRVAQTSKVLREVAVDAFAYHQKLEARFSAYADRPSNSILLPSPSAPPPGTDQIAFASRRAYAFHLSKERLEILISPEKQRQARREFMRREVVRLNFPPEQREQALYMHRRIRGGF